MRGRHLRNAAVLTMLTFAFVYGNKQFQRVSTTRALEELNKSAEDFPISNDGSDCKESADLFPGKFTFDEGFDRWVSSWNRRGVWTPDNCKLPRFEELNVKACLEKMNQVWFGDSLTRNAFLYLGKPIFGEPEETIYKNTTEDAAGTAAQSAWKIYDFKDVSHGMMRFYWSTHSEQPGLYTHPDAQRDLKEADLVWVGAGAWDMGSDYRPVDVFFHNYMRRVKDIQSKVKPGTKVVLYPLYWYNLEVQGAVAKMHNMAYKHPSKLKAYREALYMVAACLGTGVVDAKLITKGAGNHTSDGVHFDPGVMGAVGDVLVNAVCREPRLDLTAQVVKCDFEAAYARWQADPELDLPKEIDISRYKEPDVQTPPPRVRPVPDGSDCKESADLFPGKFTFDEGFDRWVSSWNRRAVWTPDYCKLPRFEELNVKECLEKMNQVWFGDSFSRDVFQCLGKPIFRAPVQTIYKNLTRDAVGAAAQSAWDSYDYKEMSAGMMRFYWSSHSTGSGLFDHPDAQRDLKEADLVWVGAGAWDMGSDHRPVDVFFQRYLRRVKDIQDKAREGARVVLFPLHWYNLDVGGEEVAEQFKHPNKIKAYREALHMVAACLGTEVIDARGITKGAGNWTRNGVHFDPGVMGAVGDVLVNAVCKEPRLDLTAKVECDFESAYARWQADPELGLPEKIDMSRYKEGDNAQLPPPPHVSAPQPQPVEPEMKVEFNEGELCGSNADLFPGKFTFDDRFNRWEAVWNQRAVWVPDNCKLPRFEELNVKSCFENMNQIWFGDSVSRDVFNSMGKAIWRGMSDKYLYKNRTSDVPGRAAQGLWDSYSFKKFMSKGNMQFYWSSHSARACVYDDPDAQRDIKTADVVWMGAGSWDMGIDSRPVDVFFHNYMRRVKDLQSKVKPGAQIILYPLHYFNIDVHGDLAMEYNKPDKLKAYREALHMVAACLGTGSLDAKLITKGAGNLTRDGVHFDPGVVAAIGDVFVNAVCREPRLDLTAQVVKCDFEAAYARWQPLSDLGLPAQIDYSRYEPE